jgi:hypothetical protein
LDEILDRAQVAEKDENASESFFDSFKVASFRFAEISLLAFASFLLGLIDASFSPQRCSTCRVF